MPDKTSASALGKLLDPLLTLARHHGLDTTALLTTAELTSTELEKPGARFAAQKFAPLLEQLAQTSGNPLIALRLGEITQPRMLGSTGFLMSSAATLHDAYQVLIDYLPLLFEGAALQLEQTLEGSWLTLELNDSARKPTEYFLACLANWPRWLTGHQVPLQRLELSFDPPDDPQAWQRFFAAEVQFAAPHNRLLLATDYLSLTCLDANAEMHQLHREFADSLLSDSAQRSALIAQTRHLIRHQLAEGEGCVRREQVAEAVNLSLRTLQRKLGQLGTSFQEVYDQTRREQCLQLIQRGQLSFGEIAFRLGFSNQSAFQKAFKRWMGVAPSHYRAQLTPLALQPELPSSDDQPPTRWYQQADTDNAITQRLAQLGRFNLKLLEWATLCGMTFDLGLIAQASNNPLARLAIHLWPAQQRELVSATPGHPNQFSFTHPDIRTRLLQAQSSDCQQQRHLQLADALLAQPGDSLTTVLHHLNQLHSPPSGRQEQLATLNQQAVEQCAHRGHYSDAVHYAQQHLRWQAKPAAQQQARLQIAQYQLLAGQPEASQNSLELLYQAQQTTPATAEQQARQTLLQAELWQQQQQPDPALQLLCQTLAQLDQPLPEDHSVALRQLLLQLARIEQQLDSGALAQLSPLSTPGVEPILALCEQVSLLAQQLAQPLLAACAITRMTELALQYGHNRQTPFAFISYAWVASWFCGDETLARQFSAQGLMLATQQACPGNEPGIAAAAHLIQGCRVSHWFNPLSDSRQQLQQAAQLGSPGSWLTQQATLVDSNLAWLSGTPLDALAEKLSADIQVQQSAGLIIQQLNQTAPETLQTHPQPDGWRAVATISAALLLDQQQLWPGLYNWEVALEQQLAGSFGLAEALFSTALMRLIQAQPRGQLARRRAEQVAQISSRLEHWARHCPENFSAQHSLICAEQARLSGQSPTRLYEQALQQSEQQPALHHRGLCYERYADYLQASDQPRLARFCLQAASQYYQQWGASAKVKQLARLSAKLAQ